MATVTGGLFAARNTLMHRILVRTRAGRSGWTSARWPRATGQERCSSATGLRASAWKQDGKEQIVLVTEMALTTSTWNTSPTGSAVANGPMVSNT
ncbi:3a6ddd58-9bd3-4a20-83a8-e33cd5c2ba18 [Thermothielavioides terrestris]|uniref:3a6ddd58-9bd3-4a20-83a8-e33cd5c2ba18 n=1 Tax=Thermothielavioides terrestris TaxID=2587410 RepID=A0A446BUK3_9PEZI|nr:3a6ddd58-9bd3-4a20-83a8-e33cd5c2ba18 [Thermothielavioides terrestris]